MRVWDFYVELPYMVYLLKGLSQVEMLGSQDGNRACVSFAVCSLGCLGCRFCSFNLFLKHSSIGLDESSLLMYKTSNWSFSSRSAFHSLPFLERRMGTFISAPTKSLPRTEKTKYQDSVTKVSSILSHVNNLILMISEKKCSFPFTVWKWCSFASQRPWA